MEVLKKFTSILLEEGIIENIIFENETIDVDTAWEIKKSNAELAGNKPYCVLISCEPLVESTTEAKELASSEEFRQLVIAKAIVINSLALRLTSNFYLRFHKPKIKTRLFNSRNEAIDWLRKECNQHKK